MRDDNAMDGRSLVVSTLAIGMFVAIGYAVAVFGAPAKPTPVLSQARVAVTPTSTTVAPTSSTVPAVAEPIEIVFPPTPGLGFQRDRTWTFDPETRTLENVVTFRTDLDALLVAHIEVVPPSLVDLGDFDFEPLTDDVVSDDDGTKEYRFEVKTTKAAAGTSSWAVVTQDIMTKKDLESLAAEFGAAAPRSFGNG